MNINRLIASNPLYSVWVAASAGTGKTKLLTDRVLRLLLARVPPEKILCLTFTKSAAAEMSSRIAITLGRWFGLDEAELEQELYNLMGQQAEPQLLTHARDLFLLNLDSSFGFKIQTIHSFCQLMLQKFPLEAGLSPSFEVIDEFLARDLLNQAKHLLLQKLELPEFNKAASAMRDLAGILYESSINQLLTEVITNSSKIIDLISHHQDLDHLIDYIHLQLGCTQADTPESILGQFIEDKHYLRDELGRIGDLLLAGCGTDIAKGIIILNWRNSPGKDLLPEYINSFLTLEDQPRKMLASKKLLTANPEMFEVLKAEQYRVFNFRQLQKSCKIATLTTHLLYLHEALMQEYTQLKQNSCYLDYQDLIITAVNLLNNKSVSEWIKYKLDLSIDHILVDEAQDVSKEQWSIISNLALEFFSAEEARSLFVVGDEKQSIFSFQGANLLTFMYMKNYFSKQAAHLPAPLQILTLETSYRSAPAVLQVVDSIFDDPDLKASITTSTLAISHNPHRNHAQGYVEVWPLVREVDKNRTDTPWRLPEQMIIEQRSEIILADLIVAKIEEWISSKRLLHSKNRPVTAGDIMILIRRRNSFTDYLVKALKRRSIDTAGLDKITLTDSIAILDLIAVANFVLLTSDDLNLACLLKSPLIDLNEEQLAELATNRENITLWQSLQNKQNDQPCFMQAYTYLSNLLLLADKSPFSFYAHLLDKWGGRQKLCQALTREVNDQLDELLNLALKYQASHPSSLQGFIYFLQSSNIVIKRDLENNDSQVKIMTVHRAKGLQAPIVILPDTTFLPISKSKLLWSDKLLLWPGSVKHENLLCAELKKIRKKSEQDEYLRLLYVALTRAEDETIICGWQNKLNSSDESWYNIVASGVAALGEQLPFSLPSNFKHDPNCFRQDIGLMMIRFTGIGTSS